MPAILEKTISVLSNGTGDLVVNDRRKIDGGVVEIESFSSSKCIDRYADITLNHLESQPNPMVLYICKTGPTKLGYGMHTLHRLCGPAPHPPRRRSAHGSRRSMNAGSYLT